MTEQILGVAIPFFILFILVEAAYSLWKKKDFYRVNDAVSSLSCGSVTILVEVFSKIPWILLYIYLFKNFSIVQFPISSIAAWIIFFMFNDFLYYWAHRLSHEINFLWSGHLPHHQSEEYNLTTALRQGALQGTIVFPIYLPMAILGCPIEMYLVLAVVNKLYQFWIHTRTIDKVPLIEGILNTPSAHRVHHAVNQAYVDRNYGGTFMVFDKWFGTWVEEDKANPAVYGVRKPYRSFNPIKAHIDWWIRLGKDAYHTKSWKDKIKLWFMPTGWRPKDVSNSHPWDTFDLASFEKYDPKVSSRRQWLSLTLYAIIAISIPTVLNLKGQLLIWQHALIVLAYLLLIYLANRLNY
ncbi:sterol desaturase family protein [Kangiella sp. TOML190]|uniref:sterol desaturase family protein n=1 Tax=Kangiella sp. TOML190 TaxID=2931351 RepID=UPI00203AA25C|nr:sterol desaturase family protein [Kangiella sp. TOML190]